MKIQLSHNVKIRDIKKEFEKSFPYLKLEFFKKKHGIEKGNPYKDMVFDDATLLDVTGVMREGEIAIRPWQSVAEVEQLFQSKFNLPVQIFRKTRHSWIETTKSDHQTMQYQNKMGREACDAMYRKNVLL
ncbi:MAG: hypothetical protein ACXWV9_03850 [Flavisolibacter sp.]